MQGQHDAQPRPQDHKRRRHERAKGPFVAEFTDTLVRVLGKKPEHIQIVIDEVGLENWGYQGQLTSDWIKANKENK